MEESEILPLLKRLITDAAMCRGMDRFGSSEIAQSVEEQIRIQLGGRPVYIHALPKRTKYRKIRRDFNGKNHKEVIEKHNISKVTLYRALKDKK